MIAETSRAPGLIVALFALLAVRGVPPRDRQSGCDLPRKWYAGDIHFNEQLEFRPDGTGEWISSGFDSDARHAHIYFGWEIDSSWLIVSYDKNLRRSRVPFEIGGRGDYCTLTFKYDAHPFVLEGGFTHFSNVP